MLNSFYYTISEANNLNGVCTTAKGLQLFVKTEEITSNEEIQKLIDKTKGKLTNEVQN